MASDATTSLTVSEEPPDTASLGDEPVEPAEPEDLARTSDAPATPSDAQDAAPPVQIPPDWRQVERRQRLTVIAATALLAGAYFGSLVAFRGPAEALRDADARAYFAYLPSLVLDRDLDLSNQFELLGSTAEAGYPFGEVTDGYAANPYSITPALLWLPGYLIGVVADRFAGWLGIDTGPDGYGVGAIWGVALSSIVLAGFAADLSRRVAAQLRGPEYAMPAMFLGWVGTAAFTYTLRGPIHPQSASWFCLALAIWLGWLAFRNDSEWYRWLVVGLASGVLLGIRPMDAPLLIVPGFLLLASCRTPRDLRRPALMLAAGMLLGYLPAAAGGFWLAPPAGPSTGPFLGTLAGTLFSAQHGWLVSTPLAAIGIAGVVLKARSSRSSIARSLAWGSVVALALLVVIDAATAPAADFATLRFVGATPLLILGLTQVLASLDKNPALKKPGIVALLALAAANVWLLYG